MGAGKGITASNAFTPNFHSTEVFTPSPAPRPPLAATSGLLLPQAAATITEAGRLAKRLNLDYQGDEPALLSSGLTLAATGAASAAPTDSELVDGSPTAFY